MRFIPLIMLTACAPRIAVHDYPKLGLRIIQADSTSVHRHCNGAEACAFAGLQPCEIWAYSPYYLSHELAHCSGADEEQAVREDW